MPFKNISIGAKIFVASSMLIAATTFYYVVNTSNANNDDPVELKQCAHRWIVFEDPINGKTHRLKAEVVTSEEARNKGLMFRLNLPINEGMMFVWSKPQNIIMWMKNTYIQLDMIFINGDEVVGVVQASETQSEEPLTVPRLVDKVLEVNINYAERNGITDGWKVNISKCVGEPDPN